MILSLTEEKLKELLSKAYEAGWYGLRELNDSAVEKIYKDFRESVPQTQDQIQTRPQTEAEFFTGRPVAIQVDPPAFPQVQVDWGHTLAPSFGVGSWAVTASARFGNGPTVTEGQNQSAQVQTSAVEIMGDG